MKVSCPACDSKYTIADEKVAGRKVKVRCKSCGGQILINGTIPPPAPGPEESAAASSADDATRAQKGSEASTETGDSTARDAAHLQPAKASSPQAADAPKSSPKSSPQSAQEYTPPPASVDDGIVWSVNVSENDERSLKTHEVVAGYLSGEFAGEVYVWRDGMGDWTSIPDAPELAAAIEAAKNKGSTATKHKALPTAGKIRTGEHPAMEPGTGQTAKKQAARAAGAKRPQSAHDLFAAASTAGSETDVAISESDESQKMTGARNENSVLFSLDALKAGITATPQKAVGSQKPAKTPRKKLEDLLATGSGAAGGPTANALVLNASQALLTAPAPPPPPPKPEPVVVAASVAPAAVVAPASPKKKLGMVIGIVAAIVATGVIAGVTVAVIGGKQPAPVVSVVQVPVASAPVTTPAPAATPAVAAETSKPAESAAEAKPAESAAHAAAATGTKSGAGAQAAVKPGAAAATPAGASKPTETAKKEPAKKEEPASPPSSGVASFSKEAAAQALAVAASQTSICKKPDGPTGVGKVQVTFAPSGRATTANIVSGPFGGTAVGGCVSGVFKRAKVPAFSGDPVTVSKSFTISP